MESFVLARRHAARLKVVVNGNLWVVVIDRLKSRPKVLVPVRFYCFAERAVSAVAQMFIFRVDVCDN
jgi:hypothetical protein